MHELIVWISNTETNQHSSGMVLFYTKQNIYEKRTQTNYHNVVPY